MTKESWIVEGHTGLSSKTIWTHFTLGYLPKTGRFSSPSDPADFLRCYWLLQLAPEWRERIAEMAQYQGWSKMATNWDELETMLLREAPKSASSGEYNRESGPKMYARMRELEKEDTPYV